MAGRPQMRIGYHGKITRTQVEPGVWVAPLPLTGTWTV